MINQVPIYNLSAVLKETGLKADVLRAWERRYDLPRPHRTPGGHRLYSAYDIAMLKWLRARQSEGLSISRAVEYWKEIAATGREPLDQVLPAGSTAIFTLPGAENHIDALCNSWLEACLAFDGRKAEDALNQAFAMYPVETVCTAILQRGLSSVGHYWYEGKASVQQEHFASALAVRRLETLITAAPQPTRNQTVLVGCPPGEWHTFSVLLLNLFLRRKGFKVVYLGSDIPIPQMEEAAAAIQPDLTVLAAQQLTTAAELQLAALSLHGQGRALAYGGLIFNRVPGLRERIPAVFLGESLEEAVDSIERLVLYPADPSSMAPAENHHRALAVLYRRKRAFIEAALLQQFQQEEIHIEYIEKANFYFASSLAAALELGDLAYLEADLEWLKMLLAGRQVSEKRLNQYLAAYRSAIHDELGNDGAPITEWMDTYLARNQAVHL